MGRMGSSPVVPFDSNGCPSVCDGVEESCKPPNIRTQITAGQRQRRAIGAIPFSSDVGNRDRNLLSGIFIELGQSNHIQLSIGPAVLPPTYGVGLQIVKLTRMRPSHRKRPFLPNAG